MKLTKEQKEQLAAELSMPWGNVALLCDGYRIALQVQRAKGAMTYRVITYVNGQFRGEWMRSAKEFPEQKFLRKSVRPLYSAAKRAAMEKSLGKRAYAKYCKDMDAKITMFMPDWASGKAVLAHLCKVCESVEIAPVVEKAGV